MLNGADLGQNGNFQPVKLKASEGYCGKGWGVIYYNAPWDLVSDPGLSKTEAYQEAEYFSVKNAR